LDVALCVLIFGILSFLQSNCPYPAQGQQPAYSCLYLSQE
jgi:hypothetical protein